eukprot:8036287-Prorocentrum_lima.AAC.1
MAPGICGAKFQGWVGLTLAWGEVGGGLWGTSCYTMTVVVVMVMMMRRSRQRSVIMMMMMMNGNDDGGG